MAEMGTPREGFCVKTSSRSSGQTVFVNITYAGEVENAQQRVLGSDEEKNREGSLPLIRTGEKGLGEAYWEIPYSLTPPQKFSHEGNACVVYTIVFGDDMEKQAQDAGVKQVIMQTMFESIDEVYKDELDRNFEAMPFPHKSSATTPVTPAPAAHATATPSASNVQVVVPEHTVEVKELSDGLTKLVITATMPDVKSAKEANLDLSDSDMVLDVDGKYHLEVPFPKRVDDNAAKAKFDKGKRILTITIPVL